MLSLVTVCFNNPEELEKTVTNESLQTVQPDEYVIFDSSDEDTARRMKRGADNACARYVWAPTAAPCQPIRHSLILVDDESCAWWPNSSNWLARKNSIKIGTGITS